MSDIFADSNWLVVANRLGEAISSDPRLTEFATSTNRSAFVARLVSLLLASGNEPSAEAANWTTLSIWADSQAKELANLLVDALRWPMPLGENVLLAAVDVLEQGMCGDTRMLNFWDSLRAAVLPLISMPEPETSAELREEQVVKDRRPEEKQSKAGKPKKQAVDTSQTIKKELSPAVKKEVTKKQDEAWEDQRQINNYANSESFPQLHMSDEEARAVQMTWLMFVAKKGSVELAEEAICNRLRSAAPEFAQLLYGEDLAGDIDPRTGTRSTKVTGAATSEAERQRMVTRDVARIDKMVDGLMSKNSMGSSASSGVDPSIGLLLEEYAKNNPMGGAGAVAVPGLNGGIAGLIASSVAGGAGSSGTAGKTRSKSTPAKLPATSPAKTERHRGAQQPRQAKAAPVQAERQQTKL